jgi:hypothetical protein
LASSGPWHAPQWVASKEGVEAFTAAAGSIADSAARLVGNPPMSTGNTAALAMRLQGECLSASCGLPRRRLMLDFPAARAYRTYV